MPPPAHLTAEQLAKAAARRAAKDAKRAANAAAAAEAEASGAGPSAEVARAAFLRREWMSTPVGAGAGAGTDDRKRGLRIVTWNILAQTLIRRDLFPGSDCLRWGDRKAMLEAEMAHHGREADILCLQECDRLKDLMHGLPFDSCVQARGHGKQHGLVVLYRSDRLDFVAKKVVHLDEEFLGAPGALDSEGAPVSQAGTDVDGEEWERVKRRRRGGSRQTKNVGLIVGLQERVEGQQEGGEVALGKGKGMVVATAHLFWHPKYQYERVRQLIVLVRAIRAFQTEHGLQSWPVVVAGDFNTSPSEPAYQLLVDPSQDLPAGAVEAIEASRLVHDSVERIGRMHAPRTEQEQTPVNGANGDATPAGGEESTAASLSGTGANTPTVAVVDPANPCLTPPRTPAPPPPASASSTTAETLTVQSQEKEKDDEGEGEGEGEGGGELPDSNEKSLANTRAPREEDGVFGVAQLQAAMRDALGGAGTGAGASSAYATAGWARMEAGEGGHADETFASRGGFDREEGIKWSGSVQGGQEPGWTCYTALFQLTLDYLFVLPSHPEAGAGGANVTVRAVIRPPRAEELGEGLPKKGISASDHVAVGAEFAW